MEKYLKASLLLNGRSARGYHHNIERLFDHVKAFAGDLIPNLLICPNDIDSSYWRNEKLQDFISRLAQAGNPNNRYAYFSIYQERNDLLKLDSIVYSVRRITVNLDLEVELPESQPVLRSFRQHLIACPDYQPRGNDLNLTTIRPQWRFEESKKALHEFNFAFKRSKEDLVGFTPSGISAQNSWLSLLAGDALSRPNVPKDANKAAVIRWLIDNIQLPPAVIEELTGC